MFAWALLLLLTLVALLWLAINLSPQRKAYRDLMLEPEEAGRPDAPAADDWPAVAILCPGRNEAEHIVETLPELCEQDYPCYRVVYIDDDSDDDTPAITAALTERSPHLLVVRNTQRPPAGWVGKCWAIERGREALHKLERDAGQGHDLLCFTDADIHWHPGCLRAAVGHMQEHRADVVGLFPRLTFGSVPERIVQTTLVLALGLFFPLKKAMDPKHPGTIIGGAFILVKRELYERIGGHAAVRDQVIEDINLGRKLKAAGGRIRLAITRKLLFGRMYEGWADMWEGLTKNAYAGVEYRPTRLAALLLVVLLANIMLPVYLLASVLWLALGGGWLAFAALALSLLAFALAARPTNAARRLLDLSPWYALSLPVGSAVYFAMLIASAVRYYRGGNVWKGRSYGPGVSQVGDA